MVDELNRLLEDLHDLQTYWSTESKIRKDESGKMYADGMSHGFKYAAIALHTVLRKYSAFES
ncbi:hypothetical protein [Paenibacillus elgii]|uniref:hypothetical protein n=1 Tax=Paenibacillus elgii TaxID=189691 RepID=UPI0013CF66F8|nr:hypothetical protein [Paenibacillus elgii]